MGVGVGVGAGAGVTVVTSVEKMIKIILKTRKTVTRTASRWRANAITTRMTRRAESEVHEVEVGVGVAVVEAVRVAAGAGVTVGRGAVSQRRNLQQPPQLQWQLLWQPRRPRLQPWLLGGKNGPAQLPAQSRPKPPREDFQEVQPPPMPPMPSMPSTKHGFCRSCSRLVNERNTKPNSLQRPQGPRWAIKSQQHQGQRKPLHPPWVLAELSTGWRAWLRPNRGHSRWVDGAREPGINPHVHAHAESFFLVKGDAVDFLFFCHDLIVLHVRDSLATSLRTFVTKDQPIKGNYFFAATNCCLE